MTEHAEGFVFGLHLLDSLGVDFDSEEIQRCVREVADGCRVLSNRSEDDLQNMERNRGVPFEEPQRSELLCHHREWCKEMDAKNVAIARRIIAGMPQ